jgi:hypothetical protein
MISKPGPVLVRAWSFLLASPASFDPEKGMARELRVH